MGILITKRKQMRKLFIRTLALALCLTGTAQALRAQETTAAQTAATADQRPKTINEMRQERGLTDTHNLFVPRAPSTRHEQVVRVGKSALLAHFVDCFRTLVGCRRSLGGGCFLCAQRLRRAREAQREGERADE